MSRPATVTTNEDAGNRQASTILRPWRISRPPGWPPLERTRLQERAQLPSGRRHEALDRWRRELATDHRAREVVVVAGAFAELVDLDISLQVARKREPSSTLEQGPEAQLESSVGSLDGSNHLSLRKPQPLRGPEKSESRSAARQHTNVGWSTHALQEVVTPGLLKIEDSRGDHHTFVGSTPAVDPISMLSTGMASGACARGV
jgi:hypothetical protein